MKYYLLVGQLLIVFQSYGQTRSRILESRTDHYAGFYDMGGDIKKERIGSILVYPETDSTILFYIDVNRGAPSYNMGALYGRATIKNGNGIFYTKSTDNAKGCKWSLIFIKDRLKISTINNLDNCGFGFAVYADGIYKRKTNKRPEYFENYEGSHIFFKTTKPEDYYQE